MTTDELIETFETQSEMSRNPGWDSKVVSALLTYCAELQANNMRGREAATATDALILQIKHWVDAEDRLRKIGIIAR